MNTIKLPISFNPDKTMKTLEEATEDYYAVLLADALQIEPEELPLSTSYGVLDPTFGSETPLKTVKNAARHIPEISIDDVSSTLAEDGKIALSIKFSIRGE